MAKRVSPVEAKALLDEGWSYVDVRSEEEFAAGHPEGAYNIPLGDQLLAGMEKAFAEGKSAKVVIGCLAGGRSARAAAALEASGWKNVVDQRAGFGGSATEPGWMAAGLPTAKAATAGRSWKDISAKR